MRTTGTNFIKNFSRSTYKQISTYFNNDDLVVVSTLTMYLSPIPYTLYTQIFRAYIPLIFTAVNYKPYGSC